MHTLIERSTRTVSSPMRRKCFLLSEVSRFDFYLTILNWLSFTERQGHNRISEYFVKKENILRSGEAFEKYFNIF